MEDVEGSPVSGRLERLAGLGVDTHKQSSCKVTSLDCGETVY